MLNTACIIIFLVWCPLHVTCGENGEENGGSRVLKRTKRQFCEEELPPVDGIKLENSEAEKIVVTWNVVPNAERYALSVEPKTSCVTIPAHVTGNEAIIRNFDTDTEYTLSVIAFGNDDKACGSKSEFTFQSVKGDGWTCDDNVDIGNLENLMTSEVTTTTAVVQWLPTINALSYIVRKPDGTTHEQNKTDLLLNDLISGQSYSVTITPKGKRKLGIPVKITFYAKLKLPEKLHIGNVSSNFLRVEWEEEKLFSEYRINLIELDQEGKETRTVEKTSYDSSVYFEHLTPATKYRVELTGFRGEVDSMTAAETLFTKLPSPLNIRIWNVTYQSVNAAWEPVDGADRYKVLVSSKNGEEEANRAGETNDTAMSFFDLISATEYIMQVFAFNDDCDSLPAAIDVYTRLKSPTALSVDAAYTKDTSLLVRWREVDGANWYVVSLEPNTVGVIGIGSVEDGPYTLLKNLSPGTMYKITVVAENSKEHPTTSIPVSISEATKFPRPQNVRAEYDDLKDDTMTIKWNELPMTDIYYVYVYDCSKKGSKVDPSAPRSTLGPTTLPPEYESAAGSWRGYRKKFPTPKTTQLHCEKIYSDVQQAIREARETLPSTVDGQGRVNGTEVILSNLYAATRYEVVVVSGEPPRQSEATLYLQYTKLPELEKFTFGPTSLSESAIHLFWEMLKEGLTLTHYDLQILETFNKNPRLPFARKAKKITKIFREEKVASEKEDKMIYGLESSKNYTFLLTAKNDYTESFPAKINVFTRLSAPASVSITPTTNNISMAWAPVDKVQHYEIVYAATKHRMKEEDKVWTTVDIDEPHLLLTNLTPNTKYEMRIFSVNVFTKSNPTIMEKYTRLPVPENVEVIKVTDEEISLSWTEVIGRDSYKLHISSSDKQPTTWKKSTKKTLYTFSALIANQAHYIFIKAHNSYTDSLPLKLYRHTKLPKPEKLSITEIRDKSIRVRWRTVTNAEKYLLTMTAMYNESKPDENLPEDVVSEMNMADWTPKSRTRRQTFRNRYVRSAPGTQTTEVRSITYKTSKNTKASHTLFPNQDGDYELNVTNPDVIFGKLDPGVKYVIVLRAWNPLTDSLPVKEGAFTKLGSPVRLGVKEESVSNDSFILQWIRVEKASYYSVTIISEKTAFMRDSDVKQINAITVDSEIAVLGLQANTRYTIQVRAGNNHIQSYPSVVEQITKLSAVENLHVVNSSVTYKSFEISWNPVDHASGYTILISPPLRTGRSELSVSAARTSIVLSSLKDTTSYKIAVSARNKRTDGVVRFLTQFTKLLKPANFSIVKESVTSSHFAIEWLSVRAAHEYHVRLFDDENENITFKTLKTTKTEFHKLKSGHKYQVSLMAHNERHGTYSDEVFVGTFTKLRTPDNFTAVDKLNTDVSLYFSWNAVDLAQLYKVTSIIKPGKSDDNTIYQHVKEKVQYAQETSISIEHLRPASNYIVIMNAINEDTKSENVSLTVFTKLTEPANLTLNKHFYMDTEADFTWFKVDKASKYVIKVYDAVHVDTRKRDDEWGEVDPWEESDVDVDDDNVVYNYSNIRAPFHTVSGLKPETAYVAAVSAKNPDTVSDWTTQEFTTKSACSDDFHLFPSTQLSQALPMAEKKNLTLDECKDLCCSIRTFKCRSISLHRETSDCALYAEDRNTAPPLGLSKYYNHYERKFWEEVSGFQIRSLSHNNVAAVNKTVEITLTFVYVGKTGCVEWDLGEGTRHYHRILDTDCSYLCENAPLGTNCTILPANPIENSNQIKTSHVYDMNSVYIVRANVSDQGRYEVSEFKVAINEKGCIFPQIVIEEDAKNVLLPKELHKSSKLVLSATPTILCDTFPGVKFEWTALVFEVNSGTVTDALELDSFGSEILIPPLKLDLGRYMIKSSIELLDDEHDLKDTDSVYISVVPTPLFAVIKGGNMRTVGYERVVTFDASSLSHDPDVLGLGRYDLEFMWFCRNYTDKKAEPLKSGSCFPDMSVLTFDGPGLFRFNTAIMHLYVEYEFEVVVSKGDRTSLYKQQVIVKEGNPPEFYIECNENCKLKMNPTQALALNAICVNCKKRRNPVYEWTLLEVIHKPSVANDDALPTGLPLDGLEDDFDEDLEASDDEDEEAKPETKQISGWEANTTTDIKSAILVLKKKSLPSGKSFILRLNISMDGLDGRVHSFSDFSFNTNIPPENGICSTLPAEKSCQKFRMFPQTKPQGVEPQKNYLGVTESECSRKCCLTREFLCLSFTYNARKSNCSLFSEDRKTLEPDMYYDYFEDFHERIFYVGGAVVDEVFFECRNWRDEGEALTADDDKSRKPTRLTYKYTALPYGNRTESLLLYFGTVTKTPGITMTLGDPDDDYVVFVAVQICDMYGECATSNTITIQVIPPDTENVGDTLSTLTSGEGSKLGIFSTTGNSKAAAQLVQSIASIINMNEEEENMTLGGNGTTDGMTTVAVMMTTASPMEEYFFTNSYYEMNGTENKTGAVNKDLKKDLRKNVVKALSAASGGMTSIDNLKQMTSAMNSITQKPDEITVDSQLDASETVLRMANSLSDFSGEANKEDVAGAASNIIGSLGSVAKSSETDMTDLKDQMLQPKEINFATLDVVDQSPDEFEYYNKIKLRREKKRVRRSALDSQAVMGSALNAIDGTASSLLDKQMSGEPAETLSGERMEMMVQKTDRSLAGNEKLTTGKGTSIKLPGVESMLGGNTTNMTDSVDLQVMSFDDNPLGFSEDAALINSPVTMLKIGGTGNSGNDTETAEGVGISIPNTKFNPEEDMITVERHVNDTGLSISKFEMVSLNNAILILVEPEDDRSKFDVYLKFNMKPTPEIYDFKFSLPHDIWDVTMTEDLFKIFIPEKDVKSTGMVFIGIRDKLNVTATGSQHRARVRRRRSLGSENSTTYHMLISTPGCRRFDSSTKKWTGDGCLVSEHSTPETTECVCNKLSPTSIFSAEFFVPPNTINFATVFAKINIADNPAVFSTVVSLLILYILLTVWARRMDKTDKIKWELKSVADNRKEDRYLYQVTVFTGYGKCAGTQSNVFCVLFGENGKTSPRQLRTREIKTPFGRSSVNHFLVRVDKALGAMTHVHVWHDNTGKGDNRGWYLDQVAVQDVQTGERYYFICDNWLAVDEDDGKVDRILPVATAENMTTTHRLFLTTTSQKFTEDHLWISIFYRPTKSDFTRVQRLSCCVLLLFLTMIANAMWFESGQRSGASATSTLNVGPFTISPIQLWTSFCSTLMVVPVVTLVVTLFKKAKTKKQEEFDIKAKRRRERALQKIKRRRHDNASTLPNPSDIIGKDAVYTIDDTGKIEAKAKTQRVVPPPPNTWSHKCVYVAWTLVTLGVLLSAFFAILYSFEWGREKADRWLSNMMLSFWQSVLIVQPIKVIILSLFVAIVLKKPDERVMDLVQDRDVEEADKKFLDVCAENIESEIQQNEIVPPKPPSRKRLRRTRKLRAKERAMSDIVWEVIVYMFYILVLLFLCHGSRDSKGFRITDSIKKTFVDPKFGLQSVTSVEYFWRFMNVTLLPNLYPVAWYNGNRKTWRERSFLVDEQSYRVGPARLRQVRVDPSACPHSSPGQEECRPHYALYRNDDLDYEPGWIQSSLLPHDQRTDDEDVDDFLAMAWKYRSWIDLKGVPVLGGVTAYPGGGYCAELGVNYASGKFIADSLYRDAWIDHRTRAVFIEFTIYNPNVNLFTTINLMAEFPPVGAAMHFTNVVTFRLYHYIGTYGTLVVLAQAIFVIHLLYATYKSIKTLVATKKKFVQDLWNIFEAFILFFDWTIVGLTALRMVLTNKTIDSFHEDKRKYVNFQQVTAVDTMVGYFLALSAFMGMLRFLKLLRFNKRIGMLSSVLKYSARQWPGYFVLAAVFFISFIHVGYVVFSPFLESYSTLISTAESMINTMVGGEGYPELRDTYRFFGPVFYFVFCFNALFIVLNVLIAIIGESHKQTNGDLAKASNQYEMIDFMTKRFLKWTGMQRYVGNKQKTGPAAENHVVPSSPTGDASAVPSEKSAANSEETKMKSFLDIQKRFDAYSYELETKYKKLISFDELRSEVIAQMKADVEEQRQKVEAVRLETQNREQPSTSRGRSSAYRTSHLTTVSGSFNDKASLFSAKKS